MLINNETVLRFLKDKASSPMSFQELAFKLGLDPQGKRAFKKILRSLAGDGKIIRTRRGLYGISEEMSLVTGYFESHREGYGFVIPDRPGEHDVFIPARAAFGALDNDRVIARVENMRRREGRIIRILDRARVRIAGILERGRAAYFVRPKNRKIHFDLYIAPSEIGKAEDGDSVIAEITNYPSDKRPPAGKIVKVLQKPKSALEDIETIVEEFALPGRFSHAVIEEAQKLYQEMPDEQGRLKRKDLRMLNTVTIDGEHAKDFDDAISIAKTDEGFRLWVHIADVGHYVRWDTLLDKEARKRGTSVYFTDRVIPMLPKELSEDLCSLKPKVDRLAFTVEMLFDYTGERVDQKFYPSTIHGNERMTYTSVKHILVDRKPEVIDRYRELVADFQIMAELCNILKDRRLTRGSLDFDLPEPEVLLDIQGNPEDIVRAERNFAHMIIEEFMIAANEAVAQYMEGLDCPNIYRIHEEPDPMKLEEMVAVIARMGILSHKKGLKPKDFSAIIQKAKGSDVEDIINNMLLRSLKQAKYSTINVGHFGLASDSYSHFTSPIRRYPDLVTHRILRELLSKKRLPDNRVKELESVLPDIAFHSSRTERTADDAERAVLSAMRAWFMKEKIGDTFEGKVVSVTPYGLRVRLADFYVDGFLHVSYMSDDFYEYDERHMSLNGLNRKKRFSIGKCVTVRIEHVDMVEREVVFGMPA
ncbi:MAG TPA: ribonuclease R [Dissulfurispiraceae bacterium]|nr:ribonuclease R [Dissulfurispiraceae bacterium]